MHLEKNKLKVTIFRSDGLKQDVIFFVRQFAEEHSGKELVLDIMNSRSSFIPLEDVENNDIFFFNKRNVMFLELYERDLAEETMLANEIHVQVDLTNGDILNGSFFIEMPQERSRVSDYINFASDFIYLCRGKGDVILNKEFMFSVKEKRY